MKKFILLMLALVVFAIIFKTCTKENMTDENGKFIKVYFPRPEKIVIYRGGNTQTITKDNKLFSDIVSKMNSRVKDISEAAMGFDKESMKNTKQNEVVVEFVYPKKQKQIMAWYKKKYTGLIFPLTGQHNDMCFLEANINNYDGPIGPLSSPNSILEILK